MDRPAVQLTLVCEGIGPDLAYRAKRLLKGALRSYGLRCTGIRLVDGDKADADGAKQITLETATPPTSGTTFQPLATSAGVLVGTPGMATPTGAPATSNPVKQQSAAPDGNGAGPDGAGGANGAMRSLVGPSALQPDKTSDSENRSKQQTSVTAAVCAQPGTVCTTGAGAGRALATADLTGQRMHQPWD